jgi:hypothetical protein
VKYSVAYMILFLYLSAGCSSIRNDGSTNQETMTDKIQNNYGQDRDFLEKYCQLTELVSGESKVLLSKDYQGRVFTSTAAGDRGLSYGWVNHRHFESGVISSQFNPFGGEERLWLGPEGGPFSVYFRKGKEQVFSNWKVPPELDTSSYDISSLDKKSVTFIKNFNLVNYSGSLLQAGIERRVMLLDRHEAEMAMGISLDHQISFVAYESENILKNQGSGPWNDSTGVLSLWMLSMFNPSPSGVVFIPYRTGSEDQAGKIVNDDYFGKVPGDRLIIRNGFIFFRVDGRQRSKIGLSHERATSFCGSYDSRDKVLTLLWLSLPPAPSKYVNSKWGKQDDPLKGDAINSYNDGPVEDGSVMGPFYEIESSSPAAFLLPGEKISHKQRIFHFTGDEQKLNRISMDLFGLSLETIKNVFN